MLNFKDITIDDLSLAMVEYNNTGGIEQAREKFIRLIEEERREGGKFRETHTHVVYKGVDGIERMYEARILLAYAFKIKFPKRNLLRPSDFNGIDGHVFLERKGFRILQSPLAE